MTAKVVFKDPDVNTSGYYVGWRKGTPDNTSSAPNAGDAPDVGNALNENSEDEISDLGADYRLGNLKLRGIEDISAKNLALIPRDYEVIAVLPEISVDESGLYEFDVKVSDDIEPGRELKYFAFPDSEPSEDDEIVEFYDSDGEEIKTLPEDHELTVDAWFNKERIYEPVIAVKKEKEQE